MFNLKNKKSRICLFGLLISLSVLLVVFIASDGITGDKDFSEYTHDDWKIAIVPLCIMIASEASTLVFVLIITVPMLFVYPALVDYVTNKKFSDIDKETDYLVFDHNELKRACCRNGNDNGVWISVREYDLKKKAWIILEEGRYVDNVYALERILQEDYGFDRVKIFTQ